MKTIYIDENQEKKICDAINDDIELCINENIKVTKGERGKKKSTQARWDDLSTCPFCGNEKSYFSMAISDGTRGRGRIRYTDDNGQEIDGDYQTIALYYCPKCFKFHALNNMA